MGLSNAALKKRKQAQNKKDGIGDENGRIINVKAAPKVSLCTVCQTELTITKSNTELTNHSRNKHGKDLEECFPGAGAISQEMKDSVKKKGAKAPAEKGKKKISAAGSLDLLDSGLSSTKKKTGKR